jgi:hypothetical protein
MERGKVHMVLGMVMDTERGMARDTERGKVHTVRGTVVNTVYKVVVVDKVLYKV